MNRYYFKQSPLRDSTEGYQWSPVLRIQIGRDERKSAFVEAIIHSGASKCFFHSDIATEIGVIRLFKGKHIAAPTIKRKAKLFAYEHEVTLHLEDTSFQVTGYFTDDLAVPAVLGISGFFDRYAVNFHPVLPIPTFEIESREPHLSRFFL